LPASGGVAILIPGRVPVVVCCPPRSGGETVAVGKGAARSPRWRGLFIPSPDGATEAQGEPITPLQGVPHVVAAHPGLRFACPGLADAGPSGQGGNRGNGEERGQDARDTRGRDALATRDNSEEHGRDGRATHGRDARATSDNGEEHGRAGSAALTADARATSDNGEEHGRDGSAALTADGRATSDNGEEHGRGRFGFAHRRRPCYERQRIR
jgi:hypothetical protein